MNQILMIDNKKKKSTKHHAEVKSIVRFFAIVIIIFALCIIGHSSYALYRDARGNDTSDLANVTMTRVNDTLIVNVSSARVIENFIYSWGNSEQTSVSEGLQEFQEEITLPNENSVLNIILEDESGRATTYTKEIILDGVDITKPTINISKQSTSIRIEARDENVIGYITYRIDDGEEIRVDKNNEGDNVIQYALTDIGRGEHTIYVTAVDEAGNFAEDEQAIIVSSDTPQITDLHIDYETGKLIIGVSDVDGIADIEVNLNGAVYRMTDINQTEATFSLDLVPGTNTFSIKITNVNGLSAEGVREFEYVQ